MCKFTFKKLNKVAVISNFLAFFHFLVDKFTLLDPKPWISRIYSNLIEAQLTTGHRAVYSHSFFADPDLDLAVLLNADPDPAA